MKNIGFLLILAFGLMVAACGKEDRNCTKTDFIGDFVSTTVCKAINGATGPEVATIVRISDASGPNEVIIDTDGLIITVTIDGCKFSGSDLNGDLSLSGSLNGEKLKMKLEGVAFNAPLDCEVEGEKN